MQAERHRSALPTGPIQASGALPGHGIAQHQPRLGGHRRRGQQWLCPPVCPLVQLKARASARPCVVRAAWGQRPEAASAVAEHSLCIGIRLPAYGVDPVDAIADDVARTLELSHPPEPVKARACCDVNSTKGSLPVMEVQELSLIHI